MHTGLPAALLREKPSAIRDSQSTRCALLAATTHARAAPARSSSTAMGRPKRCTELLHRGSLDNCHLYGRFSFLTIRGELTIGSSVRRRLVTELVSASIRPSHRRIKADPQFSRGMKNST